MEEFLNWFTGGSHHQYMKTWDCMSHDLFWAGALIVLCTTIIIGYFVIAYHWYSNLRSLKKGLAKTSLFNMVNIFLFCGICGYLFPILQMWWPAWRLHIIFLFVLNYFTWSYALNTPKLKVVYEEVHNAGVLSEELAREKQDKKQIIHKISDALDAVEAASDHIFFGVDDSISESARQKIINVRAALLDAEPILKEIVEKNKGDANDTCSNSGRSTNNDS